MIITQLTLKTTKLKEMKYFYEEIMGFRIIKESNTSVSIEAGNTMMIFETCSHQPFYHYAYMTNNKTRDDMIGRIKDYNPLLANDTGDTDFYSQKWQTLQTYFYDPEGNLVEILEAKN